MAPRRFGQSISKITSVPIFMLLYKFAHSLMRIPLTALTMSFVVNVGARANGRVEKARRNKEERREEFVTG